MKTQARVCVGHEASAELDALGLTIDDLRNPVRETWEQEVVFVTADDPINAAGTIAYLKGTGKVRKSLRRRRWTIDRTRNLERTVHPNGVTTIVVAGGNNDTGRRGCDPCTISPKGKVAREIIGQQQLFDATQIPRKLPAVEGELFYLLIHCDRDAREVRTELSEPLVINGSGYVEEWGKRIILPPISMDSETLEGERQEVETTAPIEINVNQRG